MTSEYANPSYVSRRPATKVNARLDSILPKSDHRFADPNNWYDYPNVARLFSWGNIIRIAKVQNINDRNELYLHIGEELQNIQEKLLVKYY